MPAELNPWVKMPALRVVFVLPLVIVTGVPPSARRGFREDTAGREFRAHDVPLGSDHACVEGKLSGDRKRQHCHEEQPSHVGLL